MRTSQLFFGLAISWVILSAWLMIRGDWTAVITVMGTALMIGCGLDARNKGD